MLSIEDWNAQVQRRNQKFLQRRAGWEPKPGSRTPFKLASKQFTEIMELRAGLQHDLSKLMVALTEYPPYRSRGKGGKKRTKNRCIDGRWNRQRSKYVPHQGKSEVARRVFQAKSPGMRSIIREIEGVL